MPDVVLEGAAPFNGSYPFIPFNRYEQGQIRRLSGFMPLQYEEAFEGGDAEFIAAIAVLCICRAGRITKQEVASTYARILDMDDARIKVQGSPEDVEKEDEEKGPPPGSSSLSSDTSGPSSSRSSETLRKTQPHNGTPDSATSVSVPGMLGT